MMSDMVDSSSPPPPLTLTCARALGDKDPSERQMAANEIERTTRDLVSTRSYDTIREMIEGIKSKYTTSHNSNLRKGGLLALSSVASGLGLKEIGPFTDNLVLSILVCFPDPDTRVRFYASECLFNVVKVARETILPNCFLDIFEKMTVAIADNDMNVKNSADVLDKLLKDIVTESNQFNLSTFVETMRKQMYSANPFVRMFHLGWLSTIESIPNNHLDRFLPDFIDALFVILTDQKTEIYTQCENVLEQFLTSIKNRPESVDFTTMINLVLAHSKSKIPRIQNVSMVWIQAFLELSGSNLLPYTSGIISALFYNKREIDANRKMMSEGLYNVLDRLYNENHVLLMDLVDKHESNDPDKDLVQLKLVVDILIQHLEGETSFTKPMVMKWLKKLFETCNSKMNAYIESVFPVLLRSLADPCEEVVINDLVVLGEIVTPLDHIGRSRFNMCIQELIQLFKGDKVFFDKKAQSIIRQLCAMLQPEEIFGTLAEFIAKEKDYKFAMKFNEELALLLLTAPETWRQRLSLRYLETQADVEFFNTLYKNWILSPCALIALCLYSGCYWHAGDLIHVLSEQVITTEVFIGLDKIIQMIESPIFTFLRMQLLDIDQNGSLLYALQSFLMLMPQTAAFKTLQNRLACIPQNNTHSLRKLPDNPKKSTLRESIDFVHLLKLFQESYDTHMKQTKKDRLALLESKGVKVFYMDSPFAKTERTNKN